MTKKVYVSESNTVTLCCPHCGKYKDVDITPLMQKEGQVNLLYHFKCDGCDEENCSNNRTTNIQIERRKYFRKDADLRGSLIDENQKRYPIRVLNLSRNGAKLEIKAKQSFKPKQKLLIEFTLDDSHKTLIEKTIIIRRVAKFSIEAQFHDPDSYDINNKKLGFYLMH